MKACVDVVRGALDPQGVVLTGDGCVGDGQRPNAHSSTVSLIYAPKYTQNTILSGDNSLLSNHSFVNRFLFSSIIGKFDFIIC